MNRTVALVLLVLPCLVSCVSNAPYRPATKPEGIEYENNLLDVYPGDIRGNLAQYTNIAVAWAGIIRNTEAVGGPNGMIKAVTTVEHHYFDWEEDRTMTGGQHLLVSPRGEGNFRTEWLLTTENPDATIADVEKYAAPGKMVIVYGIPKTVEDGTIVLKYRYLRIIDVDHFSTNQFDYGRFGEPFRYIDTAKK